MDADWNILLYYFVTENFTGNRIDFQSSKQVLKFLVMSSVEDEMQL